MDRRHEPAPGSSEAAGSKLHFLSPGRGKSGKNGSRPRRGRQDFYIALSGLALGLTCALFPWYIFFNQDQFGPPSVKFRGVEVEAPSGDDATASPVLPRGGSDVRITGIPKFDLDLDPTGSLPKVFAPVSPIADQPFPLDSFPFKILHVTAGRAMIEDGSGIWVVQPGSRLPDNSRVDRIESRNGKWVVVTDANKVLAADK